VTLIKYLYTKTLTIKNGENVNKKTSDQLCSKQTPNGNNKSVVWFFKTGNEKVALENPNWVNLCFCPTHSLSHQLVIRPSWCFYFYFFYKPSKSKNHCFCQKS